MTADGHIKADRGSHEWCWTCMVEWPCPATKEATLLAENARLCEQAEALAAALEEQDAIRVTLNEVDRAIRRFNLNEGRWESDDDEELVTQWERRKRNATEMADAALRAFRGGECPGCSFQRQTGGNHDDVPTGDADPDCAYQEASHE